MVNDTVIGKFTNSFYIPIVPLPDGNGRVARLLMNLALLQDGYLPVIVPPILREDYVSLLERAHREDRISWNLLRNGSLSPPKEMLRLLQIPFPGRGKAVADSGNSNNFSWIHWLIYAKAAGKRCFKQKSAGSHICVIFAPNSGYIARYEPFIWRKSPASYVAHLTKAFFKYAVAYGGRGTEGCKKKHK